jgi:hypothetical protein
MDQFKDLLDKPMSRQEFLKTAGLAVLTLFGVANFVNYFLHNNQSTASRSPKVQNTSTSHGFGSRTFGN